MSNNLDNNKLAAAVLVTALGVIGTRELSNELFHTELPETPGYLIEIASVDATPDGSGSAAAPEEKIDLVALLANADIEAGAKVARKCASCHAFNAGGEAKQGPPLWGIVGRRIATHQGFQYSGALSNWRERWDPETLYAYLERPNRAVPGTAMNFVGLRKMEQRVNLIAWLATLRERE